MDVVRGVTPSILLMAFPLPFSKLMDPPLVLTTIKTWPVGDDKAADAISHVAELHSRNKLVEAALKTSAETPDSEPDVREAVPSEKVWEPTKKALVKEPFRRIEKLSLSIDKPVNEPCDKVAVSSDSSESDVNEPSARVATSSVNSRDETNAAEVSEPDVRVATSSVSSNTSAKTTDVSDPFVSTAL